MAPELPLLCTSLASGDRHVASGPMGSHMCPRNLLYRLDPSVPVALLCSHPMHGDPYRHSLYSLLTCAPPSPASPPRCAILECSHICSVDYTAALGLGALLEDAQKQGVSLAFVGLQVGSRSCTWGWVLPTPQLFHSPRDPAMWFYSLSPLGPHLL